MIIKICISGSAMSGKSIFIDRVVEDLGRLGYKTIVLSETASELLKAGFNPSDKMIFQETIFMMQAERERIYKDAIEACNKKWDRDITILVCDRGLLDGYAYLPKAEFEKMISNYGYTINDLLKSYDAIIQLGPAISLPDQKLSKDNNPQRLENNAFEIMHQDKELKNLFLPHCSFWYIEAEADLEIKYAKFFAILREIIENT